MKKSSRVDKPFLFITLTLCAAGLLIFFSAALGGLWSANYFFKILFSQLIALALGIGVLLCLAYLKNFDYRSLKYPSLIILGATFLFQLLVFVPGIGLSLKGSSRWIDIGVTTLQPSEFLKIAVVIFLAALLSELAKKRRQVGKAITAWFLLGNFLLPLAFLLVFLIGDNGTFVVIALAIGMMLWVSPVSKLHTAGLGVLGSVGLLGYLFFFQSYAKQRLLTYLGMSSDSLGASFQTKQALIGIGSGEVFGRGFGNSLQKFAHLPEPLGDSIFAVIGEEGGFVISVLLIGLFLAFVWRGLAIAHHTADLFGKYLVVGLIGMIGAQAFFNIAAMLGLMPLSGMPLIFVSKGGSALLAALIMAGLVLNVSRFTRNTNT